MGTVSKNGVVVLVGLMIVTLVSQLGKVGIKIVLSPEDLGLQSIYVGILGIIIGQPRRVSTPKIVIVIVNINKTGFYYGKRYRAGKMY